MKQNRFKSKVVWLSFIAQVIIVLQLTGVLEVSQIEVVNGVALAVLEALTIFGILNNSTDSKNF